MSYQIILHYTISYYIWQPGEDDAKDELQERADRLDCLGAAKAICCLCWLFVVCLIG